MSLQDYWFSWSEEQKNNFSSRFEPLFLNNLASRVRNITTEGVRFTVGKIQYFGKHALMDLTVQKEDRVVALKINFTQHSNQWKICDVTVDGALLSRHYRAQFNQILRKEGYATLIAKLDSKFIEEGEAL